MAALLSVKTLFTQVSGLAAKTGKGNAKYAQVITTLSVPVTVLLEYGLQNVFACPNVKYFEYSIMFLLGPCAPLFFVMLMITDEFNKTLSGFCGYWRLYGFRKNRFRGRCKHFLKHLVICVLKCTLAPATWFILVLLKKEVYACGKVGPMAAFQGTKEEFKEKNSEAEAYSQVLGWAILMIAITAAALAFICKKCCFIDMKDREGIELEPLDTYKAYEADCARDQFEEIIKKAAKVNSIVKLNILLNNSIEKQVEEVKNTELIDIPFEKIMEARKRLLEIYPRLCNPLDCSLDWYEHFTWLALVEKQSNGEIGGEEINNEDKMPAIENGKPSKHKNKVSPNEEHFTFKEFNFSNRFLPNENKDNCSNHFAHAQNQHRKSKRKNNYDVN